MDEPPPSAPAINAPAPNARPFARLRPCRGRRTKLGVLAVLGAAGLALAWWGARHYGSELGEWAQLGLAQVRSAGPVPFFSLMAFLPTLGCPITFFTVPAGSVFVPTLGLPLVLGIVLLSLALNLALGFWLAHRVARPVLTRFVTWLGYSLPVVRAEDHWSVSFLLRATPGPPFFVQNFILGLIDIPFRIYFVVSWPISALYACAFVIFGDAAVKGHGKQILIAVGLLVVLTVGVRWLRRSLSQRRGAAVIEKNTEDKR